MLAYGRQCTHHTSGAKASSIYVGHAFSVIVWWAAFPLCFFQVVTLIIAFPSAGERSELGRYLATLRLLSALGDLFDAIGRGTVIKRDHVPIYLNIQTRGPAQYAIAAPHPEWTPTHGWQFFVLVSPDDAKLSVDFDEFNGEVHI
jgi:hypothetical protein